MLGEESVHGEEGMHGKGGGGMYGKGEHAWQGSHAWRGVHGRKVCMAGGMHGRGVCVARGIHDSGVCMARGVCGREVHGRGCTWQGGMCGRRDGHCSGRYTSYYNAFLFIMIIVNAESLLQKMHLLMLELNFTFVKPDLKLARTRDPLRNSLPAHVHLKTTSFKTIRV